MENKNNAKDEEKQRKKCRVGLWFSNSEKQSLRNLSEKEHFSTISQFIRHRCLNDTITNSELTDKIMIYIGQKFLEEYLRHYPPQKEIICKKEDLNKPKTFSKDIETPQKNNNLTRKIRERISRTSYIAFYLTKNEKIKLKTNATKAGFNTMSKFIRDRCLKEQICKNEMISIIGSFIIYKLAEWSIGSDRNLQWKKHQLKNKFNLSPILAGLNKEKREKFEHSMKELTDAYSNEIQEELNSILLLQKQKLEQALIC